MRSGHLKEYVLDPMGQKIEKIMKPWGNLLPPLLGVIEVIHAASRGTLVTRRKGMLTVVLAEPIAFNNEDLEGMTQPHDDMLVVIA